MRLSTFRRKALANELEVEHILRAARDRIPGLAQELERLIVDCDWADDGGTDQAPLVPFRRWAETAIAYDRAGYDGLRKLAEEEALFPFVVALLTELRSEAAVTILVEQIDSMSKRPTQNREMLYRCAEAFNTLLFAKHPVLISQALCDRIRDFLHYLLEKPASDTERALTALALRAVGDFDSIARIAALPQLASPWTTAPVVSIRAIKRRINHGRK